jgi:Cu/Ag efflux pump CusA
VLTAVATTLALAPFTLPGMAGEEILHPLAVVAIGGLVTSTLVTVFVLPALYLRFLSSSRPAGPSNTGVPVMSAPGEA